MRPSLTAAIIDDEEAPRSHLAGMLKKQHPEVVILGYADDVASGAELIRRTRPELLFLDIELKDRTAFDLLKLLGEHRPPVIFTTAHESYALKAIRFSALDYLLKPIDAAELREAIAKAVKTQHSEAPPGMVDMLLKNIDRSGSERIIALPVADGLEFVHVNEILACESDSNYTTLHLREDKRLVISRTMKQFEDILPNPPFMRVHNCFLVNTKHARKYIRGDGGELLLSNNMSVPVARRKKRELLDALTQL